MRALVLGSLVLASFTSAMADDGYDVVIYGGTCGGVAAAVQVARMGKTVVLIEPGKHLGGLTSGGLGATDFGRKEAIGGIAAEFYRAVHRHYENPSAWTRETRDEHLARAGAYWAPYSGMMWNFEPHVAEGIFHQMVQKAGVKVVFGERLDLNDGVVKEGARLRLIRMESGRRFHGRVFIDATYEGDLMAKAGVSYHVGRESNATYGEKFNGIQKRLALHHQFVHKVDPYVVPGDPSSGLLPEIHGSDPGSDGEGDHRIQAYNFRLCLTDDPANRLPIPAPEGYDPARYELLLRYILAGYRDVLGLHVHMPNRKSDTNNFGPFSLDYVGGNYGYPEGDYATRGQIVEEHRRYQQGLLYFVANDRRVPEPLRSQVAQWGLPRDEFTDNGNWPGQLYVREARRMIGPYVMIDRDVLGKRVAEDSIGLGGFGMDSHNCQRYVDEHGHARVEGNVYVTGFDPYPISYRAIVPTKQQCENLLVPVCLSASHIAFGSIRMEPVFMVLGQSAATAAVLAIDGGLPVQDVPYSRLRSRLLEDGQILQWTGKSDPAVAVEIESLSGTVVDDMDGQFDGEWYPSGFGKYVDVGYRHDMNSGKGEKTFRFETNLPAGRYEVRLAYSAGPNRATNVPVTIYHGDGKTTIEVNQRQAPAIDGLFISLGRYRFDADRPAVVAISNYGTNGYVIADAAQWLKLSE